MINSVRRIFAVFAASVILMLGLAALCAAPVSAAQKVGLSRISMTLEVGETATLKLNGTSGGKIVWSMSDKKIAKYSKGGKVTGVSEGTAYIYAKYDGKKYKCKVTVVPEDEEAETIYSDNTVKVKKGGSVNVYIYTDIRDLMVGTSDESIASFTGGALKDGGGFRLTFTGKKKGTAQIMICDQFDPDKYMILDIVVGSSSGKTAYFSLGSPSSANKGSKDTDKASDSSDPSDVVDEVIRLVNEERAAAGQSALKKNDELCKNAQLRAGEISGYFSHTRPDGTECFTAITVPYGYAGENIAMGQRDAEEVMDSWMNSSGHKQNILSPNYTSMGVGYDAETDSWVQLFISD